MYTHILSLEDDVYYHIMIICESER